MSRPRRRDPGGAAGSRVSATTTGASNPVAQGLLIGAQLIVALVEGFGLSLQALKWSDLEMTTLTAYKLARAPRGARHDRRGPTLRDEGMALVSSTSLAYKAAFRHELERLAARVPSSPPRT
jgi:hypothetical protein